MTGTLDKTNEKLKDTSVGYNQLSEAMKECGDCATSAFGDWQEQQPFFQDSYIGQGGDSYLAWKTAQVEAIAETQRAMRAVGGAVVGQDYTQSPLLQQTIKFTADTTDLGIDIASMQSNLDKLVGTADPMTVDADITAGQTKINQLIAEIEQTHYMPVDVTLMIDAGYVQGLVEAAIREALA